MTCHARAVIVRSCPCSGRRVHADRQAASPKSRRLAHLRRAHWEGEL